MDLITMILFILKELLERIDVRLLPFVGVFFTLGYWLKRVRLPKWCPRIPMLLFISGFLIFTIYAAIIDKPGTALDALGTVAYGLANAAFFVSVSALVYDMKHQHAKKKAEGGKL